MIIFALLLAIAGYFVLMLLTTNLIGGVVRGFFRDSELQKLKEDGHPFIKKEIAKNNRADVGVTIFFAGLSILFLYLLYKFINVWAVAAALLLMVGRIPDLLWEIHHGRKVSKNDKPEGLLYIITSLMDWAAFPALTWGIYSSLR